MSNTKRRAIVNSIVEIADPVERLVKLNEQVQGIHYSNNEQRVLYPIVLQAITETLVSLSALKRPVPDVQPQQDEREAIHKKTDRSEKTKTTKG